MAVDELEKAKIVIRYTKKMREYQRSFFKNRNPESLKKSKEYERTVDKMIADFETSQSSLF